MFNLGRRILVNTNAGLTRNMFTSAIRRSGDHHDNGGIPGSNLPFNIYSRHKLALYFVMWFGSGFSVPFLLMAFQLKKKSM